MSNYKFLIFLFIYAFTAVHLLSGCASPITKHKEKKTLTAFDERIKLYGRLLRWEEYEAAVNMVRHKDESPVDKNLERFKNLRVTDYEIKKVALDTEYKSAVVEAEISFYFENTNSVKTIRDIQTWWLYEESNIWFIDSGLPKF